jgi:hypothetical protein
MFGGYVVSGTKYAVEICFSTYNCKFIEVYSGETVSQDNWLYNTDGTYGIIGMGPGSYIWSGFIDPSTLLATYSISLARSTSVSGALGASFATSNITFGSAAADEYADSDYLIITGLSNYSYALNNLSIGIVYPAADADSAETEYF